MNRNLLKPFYFFMTWIGVLLIAAAVSADQVITAPDKVADVNGAAISREEFEGELAQVKEQLLQRGQEIPEARIKEFKDAVLDQLINRELLFQESRKQGITVNDQELADQMSTIKERFPSETEFEKALAQMNVSREDLKNQITRSMVINALIDRQIAQGIVIPDNESKSFYDTHPNSFRQPEEVKAGHILIKVDPNADPSEKTQARKKIEEIQAKLKAGEDFAELASKHSEGPSSTRGGDLGFFTRGQMVKPFEDAAFALQPEQVSAVVETQFGYHLIKVYEKKPESQVEYDAVKEEIAQYLKREKTKQGVENLLDKLKKTAKIRKFL